MTCWKASSEWRMEAVNFGCSPPAEELAGYGQLRMRVTPPTAVIFVDGDSVGVGTVILDIPVGRRHIRAVAPGYAPFDTTLVVEIDQTYPLIGVALQGGGGP